MMTHPIHGFNQPDRRCLRSDLHGVSFLVAIMSTMRCGRANTIGQDAENFGPKSEIRGEGKRNLRGFADVVALTTVDAG